MSRRWVWAVLGLLGCGAPAPVLSEVDLQPPRQHDRPIAQPSARVGERSFVTLQETSDAALRSVVLEFLEALVSENGSKLQQLVDGSADWIGSPKGLASPLDELRRRQGLYEFGRLEAALRRGAFEPWTVRATPRDDVQRVRLALVETRDEPLLTGRIVLDVARRGESLRIVGYGEQ